MSDAPKAYLFLMYYANSRRVKVWGTATVVESDSELLAKLSDPAYPGRVERAIMFTLEACDANSPQHIHKRFSHRQVTPVIEQLQARIAELEAQLKFPVAWLHDGGLWRLGHLRFALSHAGLTRMLQPISGSRNTPYSGLTQSRVRLLSAATRQIKALQAF
jgi:hypothetical protein